MNFARKSVMENSKRGELSEEEANKMLDEILEEDEQEDDEPSGSCPAACAEEDPPIEKIICDCTRIAENSSRFSVRVMEAMRWLQHEEEDALLQTSTAEDIVGYIESNYRDDGDLYAQVRTTLKQVCSQGLVVQLLENEYHLIGPDAVSMNRTTCSNDRGDCLLSSSAKTPPKRNRKENKSGDDFCDCDTDTLEELAIEDEPRKMFEGNTAREARRYRVNDSTKYLDREMEKENTDTVSEEVAECSCSLTLTDENENECTCRHETNKNASRVQEKLRGSGVKNQSGKRGRSKTIEHEDTRFAQDQRPVRDKTIEDRREIDEEGSELNETILNDTYDELQSQNTSRRSKQHEKELKRWIKRCKEECEQRGKRQRMDN